MPKLAAQANLPAQRVTRQAPIKNTDPLAVYDWQSMGHDNSHQAHEVSTAMSVSIAPKVGVHWMTNLLSGDLGGPVIAYNPTLKQTLVYAGDERGNLSAFNLTTGQTVWTTSVGVGDSIYSTPMVSADEGSVWVGTVFNSAVYKLNAATGAIDCSVKTQLAVQMSPTEGASSNGTPMVYASSIDGPGIAGPELGIQESNCALLFSSNPYKVPFSGAWASPAYGLDSNGRALVFQGTADPDSAMYAMDATTGSLDWYFATGLLGDYDVGAAATVSAPGKNGFADGVLYFIDKKQILYALDLTTGKLIWQNNFGQGSGAPGGNARCAAALDGNTLVFGMANGVYAVNATTGATIWHYTDPASVEVMSNPAIVGPAGQEVVAFGDLAGQFHILNLATGASLYTYQTGNYITASPAYVNGHFLIASMDGFLYDFAPGGGNGVAPKTAITSPGDGTTMPYTSSITIGGTATGSGGVRAVQIAVQSGGSAGLWYNAATNTWAPGAVTNLVPVAKPGAPSSKWTFAVPVPLTGASLHVVANAVNEAMIADVLGQQVNFTVAASPSAPQLNASAAFIAPAATFTVNGSGFAANETVTFAIGTAVLGKAQSTASGAVTATLTMSTKPGFGPASIVATGGTSKRVALATVDIANAWLQAANGPQHTGFELNDSIFSSVISPGNNNYLSMAYYFTAGAAVESSPAIYDAQMFFGDDAGTLTAVQTDTAAPVWSTTIPSGASIRSAPAVDPTTGNVVFTADDGVVYVVTVAAGAAVGSTTIGGLPTSPALAGSTVFVGSDNGLLESIDEVSGTVNWSKTLAGAVHATPSLDPAAQIVVSGDDSGAVRAFASTTGAPIWQATTRGAVTGSPVITGGFVYVGSADGNVYELNESTGKKVWSFSAGTPITPTVVFDPLLKLIYAAGTNGTLYAINASNGSEYWSTIPLRSPLSPYAGLGAAQSLVFANITSGSLIAFRSSQAGRFNSNHPTAAGLATAPTVNDGTVYVGASDGGVYVFTTTGGLPQIVPQSIRRRAAAISAARPRSAARNVYVATRQFAWSGQRDIAVHVDAIRHPHTTGSAMPAYHGGPVQTAARTYAVFVNPPGTTFEKGYVAATVSALRATGPLGGFSVDTQPLFAAISDGVLQTALARTIRSNGWKASNATRFIVLTAAGVIPPSAGFCSYHSAFALDHDRSQLAVYGVVPYSGAAGACTTPAGFVLTGNAAVDAATANVRRLQRELTNDPLLNGWSAPNGAELGPLL